MPISAKIVTKKFFFYLSFTFLFLISVIIFFKISKFVQFYTEGVSFNEISVLLGYFIAKATPFILSIATFIATFCVCIDLIKSKEIYAYASLGKNPFALLTPLLIYAALLSNCNLAIYSRAIPYLEKQIGALIDQKHTNWNLSLTNGEKIHNNNVFLQITEKKGKKNLFFVDHNKHLFWMNALITKEDKNTLYLANVNSFQVIPENSFFNSIVSSSSKEMIIAKESIFSKLHSAIIKKRPPHQVKHFYKHFILSFYPLLFSILAIALCIANQGLIIIPSLIINASIFTLATITNISFVLPLLFISILSFFLAISTTFPKLIRGYV